MIRETQSRVRMKSVFALLMCYLLCGSTLCTTASNSLTIHSHFYVIVRSYPEFPLRFLKQQRFSQYSTTTFRPSASLISANSHSFRELDLSQNKLTHLTSATFQGLSTSPSCSQLIALYFTVNELKDVAPDALHKLTRLSFLHFGFNDLTSVPLTIRNMSSLTFLSLETNSIRKLHCEDFSNLQLLTVVLESTGSSASSPALLWCARDSCSFIYHFLRVQLLYSFYLLRAFCTTERGKAVLRSTMLLCLTMFTMKSGFTESWCLSWRNVRAGNCVCTIETSNQVKPSWRTSSVHLQQQEDFVCDQPPVSAQRVVLQRDPDGQEETRTSS
ncbi:hypothetical protein WMY93_032999 [Mugilogobius chulae]|uniref:Uncharacterized protein n=1 Tax=Mugilogobius chulae TaxID=88201 RepID=A0AAW0MLY8_9GOBI